MKAFASEILSCRESIHSIGVTLYAWAVKTVGENFKKVREDLGLHHEDVYQRLGYKRPANVSLLESRKGIPKPERIKEMAAVLGCDPKRLLVDVTFPYDEIRGIASNQHSSGVPQHPKGKSAEDTKAHQQTTKIGRRIADSDIHVQLRSPADIHRDVLEGQGVEPELVEAALRILNALSRRRVARPPARSRQAKRTPTTRTGTDR